MLFNSFEFIFAFLPICLLGYFLIGRFNARAAIAYLTFASLFFYGWWNPVYLWLIGASILGNYLLAELISLYRSRRRWIARTALLIGVIGNVGSIAYFKYANFLVDSVNNVFAGNLQLERILLPLGISFYTFQQIAYLVDVYRKQDAERNLTNYSLFVVFFPQLIAGPIVHHKEVLPQFQARKPQFSWADMAVGTSIFVIGLVKKVVFADNVKGLSDGYFGLVSEGVTLTFWEAWMGVAAYTLQIYFDFSGYSDMAIGLARMFGIKLPLNFASPYKAISIIEFWRRWHMTLSRFLRDYLYIPLGGSRVSPPHRYTNLLITMLLGGLWHGAGWTFVIWGGLHGVYLCINHLWIGALKRSGDGFRRLAESGSAKFLAGTLTLLTVMVAWVFFRAPDSESAVSVISSMLGLHGIPIPGQIGSMLAGSPLGSFIFPGAIHQSLVLGVANGVAWIVFLFAVALLLPNTQEIMRRYEPALDIEHTGEARLLSWRPSLLWAVVLAMSFIVALLGISRDNAFLYFQF